MDKRLIILSDLWGNIGNEWTEYYLQHLRPLFNSVHYYNSCDLGGVLIHPCDSEIMHHQFVNGGIKKAVDRLLLREQAPLYILAFSVGGTIAWKAALQGLNCSYLCLVSATRLRFETTKPNTPLDLLYGSMDIYRPTSDWFVQMEIAENIISGEEHLFYRKQRVAEHICNLMKGKIRPY